MQPTTLLCIFFVLFVCFFAPCIVLVILKKNGVKRLLPSVLIGALGFVVPQLLIRIPILNIPKVSFYLGLLPSLAYTLFLAFTAGLFETIGRFLVFRFPLKNKARYEDGLSAGLGHGWVEAMVLVGLPNIVNLLSILLFNIGGASLVAKTLRISETTALQIVQILRSTPVTDFLATGFERLFVICIHTAFSLFLFYFMRKKKTLYGFLLVTLLHTLLDFISVLLGGNLLFVEGFIAICGFAALAFCIRIKLYFEPPLNFDVSSRSINQNR